ncbi:MAG: hypothetical protein K1W22_10215 [Lachnospiraceae bacterium]
MIDEKKLIERLEVLREKCWDRARKENSMEFARKSLDVSQIIGIIDNEPKITGFEVTQGIQENEESMWNHYISRFMAVQ